jgi:hypothetical protein
MSNRRHSPTEDQYCCPTEDKGYCPTEDKGYCPIEDKCCCPTEDKGYYPIEDNVVVQQKTKVNTKSHTLTKPIPSNTHLIERGSQTSCNRKLGYYDNCTLCRD